MTLERFPSLAREPVVHFFGRQILHLFEMGAGPGCIFLNDLEWRQDLLPGLPTVTLPRGR